MHLISTDSVTEYVVYFAELLVMSDNKVCSAYSSCSGYLCKTCFLFVRALGHILFYYTDFQALFCSMV